MSHKPWSRRLLKAASGILRLIGESGELENKLRESWVNLPLGGSVDIHDLSFALSELKRIGVIAERDGFLSGTSEALNACQADGMDSERLLYFVILQIAMPIWVISGTGNGDVVHDELIPDQELSLLKQLFESSESRELFLLSLGRKFDNESQAQTGLQGELFVLSLCTQELENAGRTDLIPKVVHVSLISDQLGYDIVAPNISGENRRLEVKSTRAIGANGRFYISRNEFEVGLNDPNWFLVLVKVGEPNELLGWIEAPAIVGCSPTDACDEAIGNGRWEVAKVTIPSSAIRSGLPFGSIELSKPSGAHNYLSTEGQQG